jgi:serine/threonine protein phosphatase PrpC
MKKSIAYGAATIQGDWPVQEDGYYVDPVGGFFALADGFGGAGAGDEAARTVLQDLRARGRELAPRQELFAAALKEWNIKLLQWNSSRSPAKRGGCSFLFGRIEASGRAMLANLGANAALLLRAGVVHTLLSPQCGPRAYPGAPLLPEQALGLVNEISPEFRTLQLVSGDILLLASGGLLWDEVGFQLDVLGQIGVRLPGDSLSGIAAHLTEAHGGLSGQGWNRSVLLLESP